MVGAKGLFSKCRTLAGKVTQLSDCPVWNYGRQTQGLNSKKILKPVHFLSHPFRGGDNIIVLADCWVNDNVFFFPAYLSHKQILMAIKGDLKLEDRKNSWNGLNKN